MGGSGRRMKVLREFFGPHRFSEPELEVRFGVSGDMQMRHAARPDILGQLADVVSDCRRCPEDVPNHEACDVHLNLVGVGVAVGQNGMGTGDARAMGFGRVRIGTNAAIEPPG